MPDCQWLIVRRTRVDLRPDQGIILLLNILQTPRLPSAAERFAREPGTTTSRQLEPMKGFEPSTHRLQGDCATIAPHRHIRAVMSTYTVFTGSADRARGGLRCAAKRYQPIFAACRAETGAVGEGLGKEDNQPPRL